MREGLQWKLREPYVCNVKAFLMLLVIMGHLLECRLENEWVRILYQVIYSVHMPLFAYVTGSGIKSVSRCKAQCISSLKYYLLMQGGFVLGCRVLTGAPCSMLVPYWHLWFLLAMVWWSLGGWCMLALLPGIWGMNYLVSHHSYAFLYQVSPFMAGQFWTGVTGRVICMVTAVSLGSVILGWMPRKTLPWTRLGTDTLPVYVFHACFVFLAEPLYDLFGSVVPVAVVLAAVIMGGVYGLTRFYRPVCRLGERKQGYT